MNILFKKTTAGSSELKELMGFIDADLKIQNLIPDLNTATNDIIDLIGDDVYKKAVELYNEGVTADENKNFIYAVRYPIAVNAYRLFAESNDLSHTNNGRKMRQDDNEKQAFEWMIERDNTALEKRYYRALDDLIKFLDRSKVETETETTLYTIWTKSEAFKATHNLFIRTVAEFDRFFTIKSRLLLIKMAPAICECEEYNIKPRVGVAKLTALKQALKENTNITDANDLALIRLIQKASVSYALAWSMHRLSVQLYPEGIMQTMIKDRAKPASKEESIDKAKRAFESDFEKGLLEIELFLTPPPVIDETQSISPEIISGDKYISL
jgi:hypothetical protein